MTRRSWATSVVLIALAMSLAVCSAEQPDKTVSSAVEYYRLKMPDGHGDIEQASGLHYGRLGRREGLWLVCDRNSGSCGNKVFFIARDRLSKTRPGGIVAASETITICSPDQGWDEFAKRHHMIASEVLARLRSQVENAAGGSGPILDLEGITIGRGAVDPDPHLFVVAEQPNSLILELRLEDGKPSPRAVIANCYAYDEPKETKGGDANDGLEGIAWSGRPGEFFIVEEGTKPHSNNNRLLFFKNPKLMRCKLEAGQVVIDQPWSSDVTQAVWALQQGPTHTLNAVMCINDQTVLAVDRNGGIIFAIDVQSRKVQTWLNLYDPELLNLRERLAEFPAPRHMPYVSIEGLARSPDGDLWMVDDPAMPEGFRESCLIRLKKPPWPSTKSTQYAEYVRQCVDLLIEHGTDHYGKIHAPILVSILDVESRICPENPRELDEKWRVVRRGRRNPAGANLLTDQPLLKTMRLLSAATANEKYSKFASTYIDYYVKNLIDEKGFFWWGWHRHYDVYKDEKDGHSGNHHEIHAINSIDWEMLWEVNPQAVQKEIEAIWQWHVIDKETGEINRHGDGGRGCDFSMSAGAYIEAFTFLYSKTKEEAWLDRAKLLAGYYWARRNPKTNLFPERPNAGKDRFDGSSFVTSITGLYCHSLLKAYESTKENIFKNQATAYLKAYAEYGFDKEKQKYWGALKLDGTHLPGPRAAGGYAQYEPRGNLDLWEPYVAGYQYAIYTAQAYAYAYQLTKDEAFLTTARRFAEWIEKTPPGTVETENTWYQAYSNGFGRQGTYADKYGRTVSFFLHMYILTKESRYLANARAMADVAIKKLYHKGLFRGHPAKPYYEAMDGVGYLLYALLELDYVMKNPKDVLSKQAIIVGKQATEIDLDNW